MVLHKLQITHSEGCTLKSMREKILGKAAVYTSGFGCPTNFHQAETHNLPSTHSYHYVRRLDNLCEGQGCDIHSPLADFCLPQPGSQLLHCAGFVLMLTPFVLARDSNPCRQMRYSHCAVGCVDVLGGRLRQTQNIKEYMFVCTCPPAPCARWVSILRSAGFNTMTFASTYMPNVD